MSSVWYCIPSKRPPEECLPNLRKWVEMGYRVGIQRDIDDPWPYDEMGRDIHGVYTFQARREYLGYAEAVNYLVAHVMREDPQAEWFVTGGDDMLPDPNKDAQTIARECYEHFVFEWMDKYGQSGLYETPSLNDRGLFGVMQPTGDRWLVNGPGTKPGSECVAGSPWMGREWCRRINNGRGPLWPEYFHCGEDEELQEVAIKYGVFWQRPDLTHHHGHWGRPREGEKIGLASRMPDFLKRANSREEWQKMKKLLAARRSAGWPGSEPIA